MQFGLKLWSSNTSLWNQALILSKKDLIQFIEIGYIPHQKQINPESAPQSLPITIHAPTEQFGLNLCEDKDANKELIEQTISYAKKINAKKLIIHPGIGTNHKQLLKNLENIDWPKNRLLIENMPKTALPELNASFCYGYTYTMLSSLKTKGYNFCLDINHAYKAALSLHKDSNEYIKELFLLNPTYVHISDGTFDKEYDQHLTLGTGDINLKWIKQLLKAKKVEQLVFETPKKDHTLTHDIYNIQFYQSL